MTATYFDKLRAASIARQSLLCIGLDPDPGFIRGGLEGAVRFCRTLIETTSDLACCYKPNAAFWEQYGAHGWEGLATVRQFVPPDIPVLLDCKRADLPNTMAAYASAAFEAMAFDAATVHAYHGADSLATFTRYTSRGSTWSAIRRIRAAPICSTCGAASSRCTWPWPTSRCGRATTATPAW